jgi:hypothetical protein
MNRPRTPAAWPLARLLSSSPLDNLRNHRPSSVCGEAAAVAVAQISAAAGTHPDLGVLVAYVRRSVSSVRTRPIFVVRRNPLPLFLVAFLVWLARRLGSLSPRWRVVIMVAVNLVACMVFVLATSPVLEGLAIESPHRFTAAGTLVDAGLSSLYPYGLYMLGVWCASDVK